LPVGGVDGGGDGQGRCSMDGHLTKIHGRAVASATPVGAAGRM
jgi:hypothetical protein